MECQSHPTKKVSYKCVTCVKFLCRDCCKLHNSQNHSIITLLELADMIKTQINEQISKMNAKIMDMEILKDYETAETIIDSCKHEIIDFLQKLFEQMKAQYRKIADSCWKVENKFSIQQIQEKRNILEEWRSIILKKPDQSALFDVQNIYQLNKIQSDEELIDSSQSYILNNMSPKIVFNETALRRSNESLTKIIYTESKFKPLRRKITKSFSVKSQKQLTNDFHYSSLCKFVQGTNILFQYILQDPQMQETQPFLSKIQFRQFIAPMRSTTVITNNGIYLIGGYNKDNKPRKEVMLYERAYTTMRIIGLLKQGRVGHAVCELEENIYIFGGNGVRSLEVFNTKSKICQILVQTKWEIVGASMVAMKEKIYIIGGTNGVQTNKVIFCFDTLKKNWAQLTPFNIEIYSMSISPILQKLSENEILIFGGYYTFGGQSYNNNYMLLFDHRLNFLSIYGKGQVIYPIISNGNNSIFKDSKVIALAEIKRQRHKHGPNMPGIFTYNLIQDAMELDCIGL